MRRTGGHVAVIVAIAVACDQPARDTFPASVPPATSSVASYRVFEPGEFIAAFPPDPVDMRSEFMIERAWDLAVGADGREIYVLDVFAKRVLSLDADAKLRALIGGPGGGPGEFEDPYSIEVDPRGGVWVADLQAGRLTRFDPEGNVLEELQVPPLVRGFTVLPHGAVLYRKVDGRTVSLTLQTGHEQLDLAGTLPPELVPQDFESLWTEYDLELALVASDTVIAFRNTDVRAYGAWRIGLDLEAGRITGTTPIAFPDWITDAIAAEAEEIEGESHGSRRNTTSIPFSRGVRLFGRNLWVTPHATAPLALTTTIPLSAADPVEVVMQGKHERAPRCGWDYAAVGGRLVELCESQVRIYELLPARSAPPPFGEGQS